MPKLVYISYFTSLESILNPISQHLLKIKPFWTTSVKQFGNSAETIVSVTLSLTFSIVQGIQVRVDLPLYLADYAMAHCNY